MGYLGIVFSDLPNGGRNLRLYTYDPPGSQYNPTPGGNIYNTGHYDISLPGGPCSQSDPQGFTDWIAFQNYAQARGESRVLVTRSDLVSLCAQPTTAGASYSPPTIIAPTSSQGSLIQITGSANISQPSQPAPVQVYNPAQPIDTGPPTTTDIGPQTVPDNTLIYAGLGVLALLVLSGRRG